ncbi:MAG: acyltransferase domain-containing protein [Actinomycetota bacterium]|nr:acyltransferase domain-containing protein [Actinomycetota bacterium]
MTTDNTAGSNDGIAVIGMKGRFPGAPNLDALWENLKEGVESISTFSDAELQAAGVDLSLAHVPGFVNRGCTLEGIELFDAGFFGYSARDAETMDPQQRVFMECAWESLEDAGYNPDTFPGMIGVFAGCDQSTYLYQIYANVDFTAYGYGGMMSIGNEKDYLTTQVSYRLNLRGPSLDIQTSCSTSLVAVVMACQSLRHGYSDLALAGGVAITTPQKQGYWYQPGGILSPDGHCRPFDSRGQGTVVGNGVGVVVLKRLADAVQDGDNVVAVIKGFASNNDGAAKVGYTAPSIEGQSQAIAMAQRMAGVDPRTVGYVEAHGTATALGDPIEVAALTKAFRQPPDGGQYCAIGSVKSNVGHLSSAAGITGLLKAVLAVNHGQIPPSVHFDQPNPQLDLAKTPFFVASKLTEWPRVNGARRAGVSSFGVGGTNAHVVLEQAPERIDDRGGRETHVLVLSARAETALEAMTDNLAGYLDAHPEANLADAAFTLQVGRRVFPHRRAVVFDRNHRDELLAALRTRDPDRVSTAHCSLQDRAVVFMFSGQGTQYVGMGQELYRSEPSFKLHLDHCAELLKGQLGLDIRTVLFPGAADAGNPSLDDTAMSQPALFAVEYSLARLWMEWGVSPKAMVGHSVGEYVAACLAGVMSLEEALSVVSMRGRLMSSMPRGSMLAVALPEPAVQPLLQSHISLAAVNAPGLCVLSGPTDAIAELERQLGAQGVQCRLLRTSHAFHSRMMEPVLIQFVERMSRIRLRAPRIPYLSNLTGSWMTPELATQPEYWGHHMRQTVRFSSNLCEVMAFPDLALLEIGPGLTLGNLARQQGSRSSSQLILTSLPGPHEREQVPDSALLAWTAGQLWAGGVTLDWRGMHRRETRRRMPLPTYPFERQRYWLGPLDELTAPTTAPAASLTGSEERGGVAPATPVSPAATTPSHERRPVEEWLYVPTWRPAVGPRRTSPARHTGESWLVFADDHAGGLVDEIRDHLAGMGLTPSIVVPGEAFVGRDSGFTVRPGERADYDAMAEELLRRQEYPTRILHLWSATGEPRGESAIARFDDSQTRGFLSLILLSQALARASATRHVQIGVVTRDLHAVLGDEDLRPDDAPVLGACKVISQEYSQLRCRSIDIDPADDGIGRILVREMADEPFHAVVSYRRGRRWLEHYEQVRLEPPRERSPLLSDGDVCLITGGLGNIALLLAEQLASEGNVKFLLTGRSAFPAHAEWPDHLRRAPGTPTAEKIRRLVAIEESGSEVEVVRADAADVDEMRDAVERAIGRWGRIDGVIHGAANLSPGAFVPVASVDRAVAESHFRPKAHGLLVLDEVLQGRPIRFGYLLSSLSAVLGGLNLACYAAANAYLDAAAAARNQRGAGTWITTDWDAWTFAPGPADEAAIFPAEGQDCFRRILASTLGHVVVSTTPLAKRLAQWVELPDVATPPVASGAAPADGSAAAGSSNGSGPLHSRPDLSTQFEAPKTDVERQVAGVWEHFLGVTPVGRRDKFFELGGHSLLAIQVLGRLREVFDMDLQVQSLFEAPTVAQFAEVVERQRNDAPALGRPVPAGGTADPELDELMTLVEGLSDDEVEALLMEAERSEGGASSNA